MSEEHDELVRFLKCFHVIQPNLNDTFSYATADTERIALDDPDEQGAAGEPSNTAMLVNVWRAFGFAGICAYVAKIRDAEPIKELRTEEYERAKHALAHWTYEPD